MSNSKEKRKWSHKLYHNPKRKRKSTIDVGMQGFLCTFNSVSKERICVKEAYNILHDYGDRLYGEEKIQGNDNQEGNTSKEIEDELQNEVESLKAARKNDNEFRFQVVDSGANNCIFIKTTVPDPLELASSIMRNVNETHQQITRYVIRLIPVEVICKANMNDIKKECEILFEKHFKCEPTTFAIAYNKRYNYKLLRDEVLSSVGQLVIDRNLLHKVDLKKAHKTIIIEIIKDLCCLSVITDYFKLKKYNLFELSKKTETSTESNSENKLEENLSTEIEEAKLCDGNNDNEQKTEDPTSKEIDSINSNEAVVNSLEDKSI